MRLVTARYTQDRALLSTNYAGPVPRTAPGGGRGAAVDTAGRGGRGSADSTDGRAAAAIAGDTTARRDRGGRSGFGAPDTLVLTTAVSPARIARLKRFDTSWQRALAAIDTTRLSSEARRDLDSLQRTIQHDLTTLDAETATLAQVTPLVPFARDIVALVEARIRIQTVDAEQAAGTINRVTGEIVAMQARLEAEIAGIGATPLRANHDQALRAAAATETLRANLNNWFIFYDGYDPLFTWWMRLPYKRVDDALRNYAATLRDKVAPANLTSSLTVPALTIDAAPAPKFAEVPNLDELLSLPQDEMTDIVARFVGSGGTGRTGGRGGSAGIALRDAAYFQAWLDVLKPLDFDKLTRNAQVDYLYIKKVAEQQLARVDKPLAPNPPRKADSSGIVGAARGREGLMRDLQDELIPYTPEQLIALAEREFAWCEAEMKKASRQMGMGDDWKQALEKTKTMHPPAGGQPYMIRDLIFQAIDYLRLHDLLTVPQVDVESQHMIMMTPERQLVNPFFTGGAQMSVSYPTDAMDFDAREQSMRGNNRPWSHATAFHEMVPGHNLVGYYSSRYAGYRANLGAGGPFFGEGWPVYWETILYDMGFDATPEDKVGALFWRMHRCARIIFSLKFHMGEWSPQQAVDFLVDRVGHERENAKAEVVRSFNGSYAPLYQAAYLLGALQLRGLRRELVESKQMSQKTFHDEILRQGSMPIALLRLYLSKQPLTRDMSIDWKFYGDLPSSSTP